MKWRDLPKILLLIPTVLSAASSSRQECDNDGTTADTTCKITEKAKQTDYMDPSKFKKLVLSFEEDESILPQLRGTIDNVISKADITAFISALPKVEFVKASGYDDDINSNGRVYAAPEGYAAIGLKELKTSSSEAYNKLLQMREHVRSTTEKALHLCPGSLYIDFTTISQKTEGGAHTPHADNCIHYFDDGVVTCDPARVHPYPNRVAASIMYLNDPGNGNYEGGQFYFANRTNHGEVEALGTVNIDAGKMIYFTSGIENLHGALPVLSSGGGGREIVEPRRLALAMWYVFDPSLKESVDDSDPNDPTEIFTLLLPESVEVTSLLQYIGTYIVSLQRKPTIGAWTDHSAMFSMNFMDPHQLTDVSSRIVVERHTDVNKRPSLQYMLQESVLLHGVLDELSKFMSDRLFDENERVSVNDGLEAARKKLPGRQAS
eukprot:CCRYP_015917-RA/>CCRYP_015917-RA protein AED:0.29 eAED:0.29 QI:0/0/0/1/1/1/2/0/433